MVVGWALPAGPSKRSWLPAPDGGGTRRLACFWAFVEGVCCEGSAFAVPSQYEPPPSTSSSAAAANSRGRINEFTGSPGWPPDELEARLAGEGGVASRPAALDRARGFPAGGVPVIRQTRTSEPPG